MRLPYAKHLFFLLFLIATVPVSAQNSNKENIPYTRYGIGDILSGTNILIKGSGSMTAAWSNPFAVNTENPASYASLSRTTYEAGGTASLSTLFSNDRTYGTGNVTLAYMNVGIPIGKHAGISFGLKPQSKVYYRQIFDSVISGLGRNSYIYSGDGGLNQAFAGASGKIAGFSFGLNVGYMFGTVRNSSVIQQNDSVQALSSEFTRFTKMGGIHWKGGLMYETALGKELNIRVGGTVTLSQNLNAWKDEYMVNFRRLGGSLDQDTVYTTLSQKGKITLPLSYSAGIQIGDNDRWLAGVDVTATRWSQFRSYGAADSVAQQTVRIAAGGEYTPNALSMRNYLQRISYRLGFYYGTDHVQLRNTSQNYYALTAGASFPFKRVAGSPGTAIHTALEIGRRGTETNGLIRQNFVRFSLGISLTDKWFIKRKYD